MLPPRPFGQLKTPSTLQQQGHGYRSTIRHYRRRCRRPKTGKRGGTRGGDGGRRKQHNVEAQTNMQTNERAIIREGITNFFQKAADDDDDDDDKDTTRSGNVQRTAPIGVWPSTRKHTSAMTNGRVLPVADRGTTRRPGLRQLCLPSAEAHTCLRVAEEERAHGQLRGV